MFAQQMLPRARERLVTISGAAPVKDAAALMAKPHTDLVVVCGGDGGMVGVLTKTDIVRQITRCAGAGCTATVDAIMTRDVVSCRPDEPLQGIWSVMKARGLQRVPVLEGKLRYCIEDPSSESILEPSQPGAIEPQVRHHVEPVGPVRFYLEFYRAP